MSEPIMFISRNQIKQEMFDDFTKHYRDSVLTTEANKPGTLVQLAYVNDDASEVDIVRVLPNAEALDLQLHAAATRSKVPYQFNEPIGIEIYGTPSDFALEMMKKVAGSGIRMSVIPQFIGGFIRPKSG